jgi:putative Holliday junction resolvase
VSVPPGRVVGLDLGDRRIGVAVSDDGRRLATPYEVIDRVGDHGLEHGRIIDIVEEVSATVVVVGLPLQLDGSEGDTARRYRNEARGLAKRLHRVGLRIPVELRDERLSTVSAHRSLHDAGVDRRRHGEMVDAVAASVVLQAWLDEG